ncbi:MAG: Gfo/Idh/MocA family oxidoreductase [Sedimentisphaerales bacterium]|nr:Gfo/Idh/MocA family oxidoreductase [Sedimentisphaerales bacterium]
MKKPVNRRSFLKKTAGITAGVIGFPYIVPSSALGKAGTVAPSNRLIMAQLGCGGMGRGNLRSFLESNQDVQVVAVCDVDDGHANRSKRMVDEKYGNNACRTYRDFRELLDREPLDCVSHALPDHWHATIAIACARKGIDMYGEKPFARTIAEGRAMCNAIKRYGLIWQTGSWQRSVQHFHHAAELVRNGRIGKIEYVEVGLPDGRKGPTPVLEKAPDSIDWDMWLGPAPWRPYQNFNGKFGSEGGNGPHFDWRWLMDYSGGQLTDWAGHHIDIAHWGLGLDHDGPVEIEGKGKYPEEGIYNTPYAYDFLCKYANGIQLRVANESQLPHGMGACWYGDKGWLHVNRRRSSASEPNIFRETIGPNEIQLYTSNDHSRNFIECVKSRKETVAPAEVAHRSISVGLLGEIAMLTGRKLKWDAKKEVFIGDDDANQYLMRPYRNSWHL